MKILSGIATIMLFSAATNLSAANYCGDLNNATGPFDYREKIENQEILQMVESRHFTAKFENLIEDERGCLGGELDYTLRAFPNHHRALMAFGKLSLREKNPKPHGAHYTVECYFDRAFRFRPDDGVVRLVYGIYLSQAGNLEKAIEQVNQANKMQPDNATINYNLGLLHFKMKNYEQARNFAKIAYKLGFPLPGLRNMLDKAGQWNDPPGK